MTITVKPNQGPTGTDALISVTGAAPGAPITLYINGGVTNLHADANGNASTRHTFSGRTKEVINIKAEAGTAPPLQTATTQFTITS